jgi:hypothetical protein
MTNSSGDGYHYEDGWLVVHNSGSGQLCNPGGLSAWIEARDQNSAEAKRAERTEAAKAARRQRAEDIKVLGPLYGELATLIRKNMAAAKRPARKTAALKRQDRRRRRHIKAD